MSLKTQHTTLILVPMQKLVPETKIGGRPEITGHLEIGHVQNHNSYPTSILELIHVIAIFS